MVSHLTLEKDFRLLFSCSLSLPESLGLGVQGGPAGKDNIPILQLKWLSGKMKKLATFEDLCLPPMPLGASPIA